MNTSTQTDTQTPDELWAGYTLATNDPTAQSLGIPSHIARVAPEGLTLGNGSPLGETDLSNRLVLQLHSVTGDLTGLVYLPHDSKQTPRYWQTGGHDTGIYHPQGGHVCKQPQMGGVVYIVADVKLGYVLADAGLASVATFTPDKVEDKQDGAKNLGYQAKEWLKAGYQVVVPVEPKDFKLFNKHDWLGDTGALIIPVAGINSPDLLNVADVVSAYQQATDSATAWLDPLPLREPDEAAPYPLAALPVELQALANELQGYYKAPMPMIATCGLAILSAAGQAIADVDLDGTLKSPLSLFGLIIAESGERKSAIEKVFSAPLQEWQKQKRERMADAISDARANKAIWQAKKKGVESAIERMASKGEDCSQKEEELRELESKPPRVVRVPKMIVENITAEGLMKALMNYPTAIVLSSEGGMFLGSHGMKADSSTNTMATLNKLWDGDSLDNTRANSENERELYHRRLSVGLSVQPSVLADFAKGNSARGIGFFARFLMTYPTSTKGTRLYTSPPEWAHLALWREQITALLNIEPEINEDGSLDLQTITPNSDAMNVWIAGHNAIEAELGAYGDFCDVDDVASKTANNAARIAALLHLYRHGLEGRITAEEMQSGMILAVWYLNEAKRYFNQSTLDQSTTDAEKLEGWMVKYCLEHGVNSIPLRTAYQLCQPKAARGKKALMNTLQPLIEHHRARIEKQGNADHVTINPRFLNAANGATRATRATT